MAYKILAIDDHPETLDIVVTTLRSNGYEVLGSQSPVRGLVLAEKMRPDLVLVDMMMPEMDGKEVCRRLRANPKLAEVPIIMFTAEAEAYQKLAGFEAGADDYLTKPTEPAEMLARIESMLSSVGKPPELADEPREEPASAITDMAKLETMFADVPSAPKSTVALPMQETLIALMGARGGSGTTTAAINTAVAAAQMKIPTVLVDMDMTQGHMAIYLNQTLAGGGLNTLAQLPPQAFATQLPKLLLPFGENLQLLLTKPDLDAQRPRFTAVQTISLIEQLVKPGRCVVIDLGLGINPSTRPIIDRADQIIVCLRSERVALSAAKILLHQLDNLKFPHTRLSAFITNIHGGPILPQDAMQNFLGHPLLGAVNLDIKDLARATNKGMPLLQVAPDSEAAETFRLVTHKLVSA